MDQNKQAEAEFFSKKLNEEYFHASHTQYSTVLSQLFEGAKDNTLILDVGCGIGEQSRVLRDMGLRVVGFDITEDAVRKARRLSDDTIAYVVADLEALPFKKGVFDSCFCALILHHLPNIDKSFREMSDVLRHGGCLYSYEPNAHNPYEFVSYKIKKLIGGVSWKTEDERIISTQEIRETADSSGFEHIEFASTNFYSEKTNTWFYRIRPYIYTVISALWSGIGKGNMLLIRAKKSAKEPVRTSAQTLD